ncbi:MAG: helix-turn-helix domain-containing protein [Lachnospiraceae bacterium]|nr:helix-turn-helix domain-containing protein [Lachnospiraceae bacterium]
MKLLICDDDISTIDVLQSQIDCQELGISKILRAYNGEVAMEIIAREIPELILCDIEMPKNTGLEVLRFIYNEELPCELSFITSFENFEFAKEAIKYGATRYLMKPLDFQEMHEALSDMIRNYKRSQRSEAPADQDLVLNSVFREIRDGYFGGTTDKIDTFLSRNNVRFRGDSRWHVIYALIDTQEAVRAGWERNVLDFSISRVFEENLTGRLGNAYTLIERQNRYEKLNCFVPEDAKTIAELTSICGELGNTCREFFNVDPIFMLRESLPLYELSAYHIEASKEIYAMRMHPGLIFRYGDLREEDSDIPKLSEELLTRALKNRERDRFISIVCEYGGRIAFERRHGEQMLRFALMQMTEVCRSFLADNEIPASSLIEQPRAIEAGRRAEESVGDLVECAAVYYDLTIELLNDSAHNTDTVLIVKDYIQKHYREDLSRDQLAEIVYVTPNYLSKLFREKIGMKMREYVNLLRVNEAKHLLISTDENISDIASDLGYNNISYFSTVFRKISGMSPAEWRNGNEQAD